MLSRLGFQVLQRSIFCFLSVFFSLTAYSGKSEFKKEMVVYRPPTISEMGGDHLVGIVKRVHKPIFKPTYVQIEWKTANGIWIEDSCSGSYKADTVFRSLLSLRGVNMNDRVLYIGQNEESRTIIVGKVSRIFADGTVELTPSRINGTFKNFPIHYVPIQDIYVDIGIRGSIFNGKKLDFSSKNQDYPYLSGYVTGVYSNGLAEVKWSSYDIERDGQQSGFFYWPIETIQDESDIKTRRLTRSKSFRRINEQ